MSSPLFVVKLCPDALLHRFALGSGVILMLVGIFLVSNMEWPFSSRPVVTVFWVLDCSWTLRGLAAGLARVNLIILDLDGGVRTKDSMGETRVGKLATGSFIFARVAWLRLRNEGGGVYTGLFMRSRMNAADWHRLQLLWQQSRLAFGHPAGP